MTGFFGFEPIFINRVLCGAGLLSCATGFSWQGAIAGATIVSTIYVLTGLYKGLKK